MELFAEETVELPNRSKEKNKWINPYYANDKNAFQQKKANTITTTSTKSKLNCINRIILDHQV